MTFDDVVNRILAKFDCDQATAVLIANERQARMVAESHFRLQETTIGMTAVGVSDYALAENIENVAMLQLGADTQPYVRASPREMADIRSGRAFVDDAPGAFAIHADASGVKQVRINPTPTVAGTSLIAWTTVDAPDTVYGTGLALVVPRAVHMYLLDGCLASGYELVEDRVDLAAPFEQRYEAGIEKLRRYKNARLGSGTTNVARGW